MADREENENWERARTDEQKEQRIAEIVAATVRLYETGDYDDITFAAIAREANFTRSNLYKYFETKEEIFLELIKHDFKRWVEDLSETVSEEREYGTGEFAYLWAAVLVRHPRFIRLLPMLNTTLETNVSLDKLVEFKKFFFQVMATVVSITIQALPAITIDRAIDFLRYQGALVVGLSITSRQTDLQKKAIDEAGGVYPIPPLEVSLSETIGYVLRGLIEGY